MKLSHNFYTFAIALLLLEILSCGKPRSKPELHPSLILQAELQAGSAVSASPLIEKDGTHTTLYAVTTDGSIIAWDIEKGKELWRFNSEVSFEAAPLMIDGSLYAASLEGELLAIDAKDGRLLKKAGGFGQIKGGLSADNDGKSFYAGSYDNNLYKLKTEDLSVIWKFSATNFINGKALLFDDYLAFGSCDAKLYVLERISGRLVAAARSPSYIPSTPAAGKGDIIYYAAYEGEICAWSLQNGTLWTHLAEPASPVRSPVTLAGGKIIYANQRGRISALDAKTGAERWHFEGGSPVDFEAINTPAGIISAGADGTLYLLDHEDGGELLSYPLGGLPSLGAAWHEPWLAVGTSTGKIMIFRLEMRTERK